MNNIRQKILDDPIKHVPGWTVAAFDPTLGNLPRRELDIRGLTLYLQALDRAGAKGVLLAGSTGWGHVRNFSEHESGLLQAGAIPLKNCVKQALLRIEDGLEQNSRLIKALQDKDYGILWTRRGADLSPEASDEAVAKHMLPLVSHMAELGFPVGIYSVSSVDGAPLRASAASLLLEMLGRKKAQHVVAVKITESDFESSTAAYLASSDFKRRKIVQGWDAFYARALKAGLQPDGSNRCGATSGSAACMVHAYDEMYQAVKQELWDKIAAIQEVVTRVFLSMQGEDKTKFPDLQIAKWVMGLGQPLTESRDRNDAEPLLHTLKQLKKEEAPYLDLIVKSLLLMDAYEKYRSPVREQLLGFI